MFSVSNRVEVESESKHTSYWKKLLNCLAFGWLNFACRRKQAPQERFQNCFFSWWLLKVSLFSSARIALLNSELFNLKLKALSSFIQNIRTLNNVKLVKSFDETFTDSKTRRELCRLETIKFSLKWYYFDLLRVCWILWWLSPDCSNFAKGEEDSLARIQIHLINFRDLLEQGRNLMQEVLEKIQFELKSSSAVQHNFGRKRFWELKGRINFQLSSFWGSKR